MMYVDVTFLLLVCNPPTVLSHESVTRGTLGNLEKLYSPQFFSYLVPIPFVRSAEPLTRLVKMLYGMQIFFCCFFSLLP